MRISQLGIRNFRGIRELTLPMSAFGCIIGENNAGKSTVLQALDVFFNGPSLKPTDYYDRRRSLQIEVTLTEIGDADLARLAPEHRQRITEVVEDGRLILSRVYGESGKGALRRVAKVPREDRFRPEAVAEVVARKTGAELREAAVFVFPELQEVLASKTSQKAIKEAVQELVDALPEAELELRDVGLSTGIDSSVQALLPEVIYIPAVKDLSDDLKTSEAASFGKLLGILFNQTKGQFDQMEEVFNQLHKALNLQIGEDGSIKDERLPQVKMIEGMLEGNLQQAFPRASISIEFPPPELRSVLSNARIAIDDGIRSDFKSKGDGLRRSVTFSILRTYADLRASERKVDPSASPRPYLLLFEEPELFLHPQAQRQLFESLKVFAEDNHVLVSTHSSSFFSPQATGTFVKLTKDYSSSPPESKAYPIDLSDLALKDQFQLIRQENNDAAFFCNEVLLVEGDSDHILVPHLAKSLNGKWDFEQRSIAIARLGGKARVARYREFFERFGVRVAVLVDLDAITDGFDKLGAGASSAEIQQKLVKRLGDLASAGGELTRKQLQSMQKSGEIKRQWQAVKAARESHSAGNGTLDAVVAAMDSFFEGNESRGQRRAELENPTDEQVGELKAQLLEQLRTERIYVLERGDIESYYPQGKGTDKPAQAQGFCEQYPDGDSIRGLLNGGSTTDSCEFDAIFASLFES
ncbi:ATP-dependent nuclease [Kitasatospora phosalacinea]|uniref:ATP-dependent nuclease n=1 Tax=Kitasatospora phosalacinea TaxID=2065 RepID=UPI000B19CB51|nr:AAA family ATPase [Kitasatospora phosalacinea]